MLPVFWIAAASLRLPELLEHATRSVKGKGCKDCPCHNCCIVLVVFSDSLKSFVSFLVLLRQQTGFHNGDAPILQLQDWWEQPITGYPRQPVMMIIIMTNDQWWMMIKWFNDSMIYEWWFISWWLVIVDETWIVCDQLVDSTPCRCCDQLPPLQLSPGPRWRFSPDTNIGEASLISPAPHWDNQGFHKSPQTAQSDWITLAHQSVTSPFWAPDWTLIVEV